MDAVSFEAPAIAGDGYEAPAEEVAEPGAEAETEGDGGEPAQHAESDRAAGPFKAIENGRLTPDAKKYLDEIRSKYPNDPKAQALLKRAEKALYMEDRFRTELPNGFKDIQALRSQVEQLGGEEGIQESQGELNGWRDFDEQYTSGDPKVLEFLTETPEAAEAFLKIVPAAINKYRELNPEGYNNYFARMMTNDLHQEDIPITVRLLGDLLTRTQFTNDADKNSAKELWTKLSGYVSRVEEYSRQEVKLPARAAEQPDQRASDLDRREQGLLRQEFEKASDGQHGRIFGDDWKRLVAPLLAKDPDKAQLVRRLYGMHLKEQLAKSDPGFDQKMGRFLQAKDKNGFLRTHDATFKKAVPLALRAAMAEAGIGNRAKTTLAGAPANGRTPPKPAADGTIRVAAKPVFETIDRRRTSREMWLKHQYYMPGKPQVHTWGE